MLDVKEMNAANGVQVIDALVTARDVQSKIVSNMVYTKAMANAAMLQCGLSCTSFFDAFDNTDEYLYKMNDCDGTNFNFKVVEHKTKQGIEIHLIVSHVDDDNATINADLFTIPSELPHYLGHASHLGNSSCRLLAIFSCNKNITKIIAKIESFFVKTSSKNSSRRSSIDSITLAALEDFKNYKVVSSRAKHL
ncbi:uncharacterized protein LOC135836803 [Planococcus citri]|uniref:uncharacterized protein LOC135836803 n=1 Tax=Planococcus citri TaxID=170843 RepID=UPI0031F9A55B